MRMMPALARRMEEDGTLFTLELLERIRGCVGRVAKPLAAIKAAVTQGKTAPMKR